MSMSCQTCYCMTMTDCLKERTVKDCFIRKKKFDGCPTATVELGCWKAQCQVKCQTMPILSHLYAQNSLFTKGCSRYRKPVVKEDDVGWKGQDERNAR